MNKLKNKIKNWLGITKIEQDMVIIKLEIPIIQHDIKKLNEEVNVYPYVAVTDNSLKELVFGLYKYLNVVTDVSFRKETETETFRTIREFKIKKRKN